MGDLRNVLNCLEGRISNKSSTVENVAEIIETDESDIPFKHGETVACVWHEVII